MILQIEANIEQVMKISLFWHFKMNLICRLICMCKERRREPGTFIDPVHTGLLVVLVSVCGVHWANPVSVNYIIEVEKQGKPPFICS